MIPSVRHEPIHPHPKASSFNWNDELITTNPGQIRWKPFTFARGVGTTFVEGLHKVAGAGDAKMRHGISIYVFSFNSTMENEAFVNSDGDFLIVPQEGKLLITTEFGKMIVDPEKHEICIIQQGMKFAVEGDGKDVRGYVLEVFDNHFSLPDLGPIGANGLANPRDFLTPNAWIEKDAKKKEYNVIVKFQGNAFCYKQDHSPFDVVGWHGNYVPCKYS